MLLFKGILVGIGVALVSLILYGRWQLSQVPPHSGPVSIDIRGVEQFIGGMGIGVGVVTTAVLLGFYALRHYAMK